MKPTTKQLIESFRLRHEWWARHDDPEQMKRTRAFVAESMKSERNNGRRPQLRERELGSRWYRAERMRRLAVRT